MISVKILDFKMVRTMEMAKYFVVDESEEKDWHHYALNFDVYTHFTSPIRFGFYSNFEED